MEAGWHHDPTGRHRRRYFDGSNWTDHVEDAGQAFVDPYGAASFAAAPVEHAQPAQPAAAVAPPAASSTPAGAAPVAATQGVVRSQPSLQDLIDGMGSEPLERPAARFNQAIAGGGGALLGLGITALAGDTDSGSVIAILGLLSIGIGLAVRLRPGSAPAAVTDAATGCGAIGVALVAAGITFEAGDDSSRILGLIAAILYFGLWAAPGYKGRPIFFGLGVTTAVAFLLSLFSNDDESSFVNVFDDYAGSVTQNGIVYLIIGLATLGATALLDRKGYRGLGTPFAFSALWVTPVGAILIWTEDWASSEPSGGGPLLVVLCGAAMGYVGTVGARRATAWSGAVTSIVGLLGLLFAVVDPNSSEEAAVMLLFGACVMIAVPIVVARIEASRTAAKAPAAE